MGFELGTRNAPVAEWDFLCAESRRSRSSDFHCNERHQRDHRYNPNRAYPDSCLEYGPDRFASRCHCADDNNREDNQHLARPPLNTHRTSTSFCKREVEELRKLRLALCSRSNCNRRDVGFGVCNAQANR